MKGFLIIIASLIFIFFIYSSVKEAPSPYLCYAAYDHYDGNISAKFHYRDEAKTDYKLKQERYSKSNYGSYDLYQLGRVNKFRARNMLWKFSDYFSCMLHYQLK